MVPLGLGLSHILVPRQRAFLEDIGANVSVSNCRVVVRDGQNWGGGGGTGASFAKTSEFHTSENTRLSFFLSFF